MTLTDNSPSLEIVLNKGPLLTVAMALFSNGSYIPMRLAHPSTYAGIPDIHDDDYYAACIDVAPLILLLTNESDDLPIGYNVSCITNLAGGANGSYVNTELAQWIYNFNMNDTERLTNAFNAAAFLANQTWMLYSPGLGNTLIVSYDLGEDTQVPSISNAGMVLISVLLVLYLAALFTLAMYSSRYPRWTIQLDSFTMMRLGAAVADRVPLLVGNRTDDIKVLDEIPGWIGDEVESEAGVGRLGLGAQRRLNSNRRYACYPSDNEVLSEQKQKDVKGVIPFVQALDVLGGRA